MEDKASNEVLGENLETPQNESSEQTSQDMSAEAQQQQEDYFANLVGEDKQYKTPQALAESKLQADKRIDELKAEMAQLQEVAQKAKTTEDIIAALQAQQHQPQVEPRTPEVPAGLTPEDLEKWYQDRQARAAEEERVQKEVAVIKGNQEKAWEMLSSDDAFGSKEAAKQAIAQYIGEDPAKAEIINQMGGRTPESLVTFLKAAVPKEKVNFSSNKGTVSPPSQYDKVGILTWDKVKSMEKENPKLKRDLQWRAYVSKNLQL